MPSAARVVDPARTVLIVDDEPDLLFLLRIILETAGYSVVEAANGAEALDALRAMHPDMVITDLMMPVMDGKELVRRLKADEETASIPVLVLTAYPGGAPGADDIMRKPFRAPEIIDKVLALIV